MACLASSRLASFPLPGCQCCRLLVDHRCRVSLLDRQKGTGQSNATAEKSNTYTSLALMESLTPELATSFFHGMGEHMRGKPEHRNAIVHPESRVARCPECPEPPGRWGWCRTTGSFAPSVQKDLSLRETRQANWPSALAVPFSSQRT